MQMKLYLPIIEDSHNTYPCGDIVVSGSNGIVDIKLDDRTVSVSRGQLAACLEALKTIETK